MEQLTFNLNTSYPANPYVSDTLQGGKTFTITFPEGKSAAIFVQQSTDGTTWQSKQSISPTHSATFNVAADKDTSLRVLVSIRPESASYKDYSGGGGGISQEFDPTVPSWAKQLKKPEYTASEIKELGIKDASVKNDILTITKTDGTTIEFEGGGTIEAETVRVVIRSSVEGVSVAGLKLYVYLNDDSRNPTEVTTDNNGMCAFKVTADYKYRIVFPDIEGCNPLPDIVHTAMLKERAIEVEYTAEAVEVEIVNVFVKKFENGTNAPWANHAVKVDIEGAEYDYQTDNNGLAEFEVPIGKTYTVSVDAEEGLYVPTGYSHTFTARRTTHIIHFNYYGEAIGLFIVDKFGDEYSNTEWVAFGKDNADAKYIKIATPELLANEGKGVYYIKIDDIYNAEYLKLSKQWCTQNVQFNSIPVNGNSATALFYYDGKGASDAVITEAEERGVVVPAFTECASHEESLGNGDTLKGFLWSVGQNRMLYNNREMLDSIIRLVRPDAVNDFSLLCRSTAWTSTQNGANYAYYVSAGVSSTYKSTTSCILVCYAPSLD